MVWKCRSGVQIVGRKMVVPVGSCVTKAVSYIPRVMSTAQESHSALLTPGLQCWSVFT